MKATIRSDAVRELRRDLKAVDKALPKEVTKSLKDAAGIVAQEASALAPKRTGRLARSIRPGVRSGTRAVVRSSLPYAKVISYGSTVRGIKANPFLETAADRKADEALRQLDRDLTALMKRHDLT